MTAELPPVERLQAVETRPGDVIVATVPDSTTREQAEHIKAQLTDHFPDNRIIVVTNGITLTLNRPATVLAPRESA